MQKNIRRLTSILAALTALTVLTACAMAVSQSPEPAPSQPAIPAEGITLKLWTHDYQSYNDGLKNKWIPEFEALHPGVKIEYSIIPYSGSIISFDSKLLAEVSSGGGPDVWAMASHNFTQAPYLDSGLLKPLDPAAFGYTSLADLTADYPPHTLDAFIKDGKIFGLIGESTTLCLFYNQSVFDQAGIAYLSAEKPASWQQIGEISQKLLQIDPATSKPARMGYQYGFFANYPAPEWYIQDFYPVLRQYGQDDLYINSRPAANTQAMVQAFQHFYDFTFKYQAYDPYFVQNWFSDFATGRVGMVTAGPWYPSVLRTINPDVRFGVAPHPVVDPEDKKTYQNIVYSFGWVINANSDSLHQQLAQEFLVYILGKKGDYAQPLWWLQNVGMMQPRSALINSAAYQEILTQEPWNKCFDNTFADYNVNYYQHSADDAGSALVRAINRVVYDQMAPKDTANLLQNELLLLP